EAGEDASEQPVAGVAASAVSEPAAPTSPAPPAQPPSEPREALPPSAARPVLDELTARDVGAAVIRYRPGTAGEAAAGGVATAVRRARRRLAGLGSEPW